MSHLTVFVLWIDSLHKIIKNLKATTWLSHFWMYPFSPLILSVLRKFEHLLSIYYQSWKTMFLAERDIKLCSCAVVQLCSLTLSLTLNLSWIGECLVDSKGSSIQPRLPTYCHDGLLGIQISKEKVHEFFLPQSSTTSSSS